VTPGAGGAFASGGGHPCGVRLSDHLRSRSDEELSELLRRRPDLGPAAEGGFGALARRAASPLSIGRALVRADVGMLVVAEALCVRHPVSPEELVELLGTHDADGLLDAVERLRVCGLALVEDGLVEPVDRLSELFPHPFGLGRSFVELAPHLDPARLREIADGHNLELGDAPVPVVAAALARWFASADALDGLLDAAPGESRDLLRYLVVEGVARLDLPSWLRYGRMPGDDPRAWLIDQGLLVPFGGDQAELPREVALQLRTGGLAPHAVLRRPPLPTAPGLDAATVDATGAEAATRLLAAAEHLVQHLGDRPAVVRKSGGVGSRELRRLSRVVGLDERDTARLVELVAAAGLIDVDRQHVTPSPRAGRWLGLDRSRRWLALVWTWLETERLPSVALGELPSGERPGALERVELLLDAAGARRDLLATLATVPEGAAVGTPELLATVVWQAPNRWGIDEATVAVTTRWALEEAELLGLVAEGAPTAAARALADPTQGGLQQAAEAALPADQHQVVLQGDLSAVAFGALAPDVAHRLEQLAEHEEAGVRYRFTEASVRRALDLGWSPEQIEEFLVRHAVSGVPPALGYLIADVVRRYGSIRVLPSAAVLVTDDEARAIEVASHRRAARVGLRLVAPTVLVSATPADELLDELRSWGYLPVLEGGTLALVSADPSEPPAETPLTWTGPGLVDELGPDEATELVELLRDLDRQEADGPVVDESEPISPRVLLDRNRNRPVVVEYLEDGQLVATTGVVVAVRADTALLLAGRRLVPIGLGGVVRVEPS
jgi:hypothetical protein